MSRIAKIALIVLAALALAAPAALAELATKTPPKSTAGPTQSKSDFWDVGLDLGLPVYGALQFGTVNDGHNKYSFSGNGTVSFPFLGAHVSLYPSSTSLIQFGLGWIHQTGIAEFKTSVPGLDKNFDWGMNVFRLDAGYFKLFAPKGSMVRPKLGIGLGLDYLSFFGIAHPDKTWSGWTVFPYVQFGVDIDAYTNNRLGTFIVGVNLRGDIVYTLSALKYTGTGNSDTFSFLWVPVDIYVTAGWRF